MIDDLLNRGDVNDVIYDIKTSEKYFDKNFNNLDNNYYDKDREIVLFTFYESLIKFRVLNIDNKYFSDYLNNIDRLFKKLNSFDDISNGINKLLCKSVANKLNITDIDTLESRNKIITYIYNNYYINGYVFHGFSTVYENDLKENGFIPEVYNNIYSKMMEVNSIYNKYDSNAFNKDFTNIDVYFTYDFVDACYYSVYSPMYFYKYLLGELDSKKINKRVYLDDNFTLCVSNVKKYIEKTFNEVERKQVLDILKEEWDLINKVDKKVSIMMIKRGLIESKSVLILDDLINSEFDLYEVVDLLLNNKNKSIKYNETISNDKYEIFSFDFKIKKKIESKENIDNKKIDNNKVNKDVIKENASLNNISNDNSIVNDIRGSVSVLILLGSMLISVGVIATILVVLGGI